LRELLRAVIMQKPIVALQELEVKHGGLTSDAIEEKLRIADEPYERNGTQFASKHAMWGLCMEVEDWGYDMPPADELITALFESDVLEWNRVKQFRTAFVLRTQGMKLSALCGCC
jgi:hypothetical protein